MNYHIRSLAKLLEAYTLSDRTRRGNIEYKLRNIILNGREIIEVLKFIETRSNKGKQVTDSPTTWPYIEILSRSNQNVNEIADLLSTALTSKSSLLRGNAESKLNQTTLTGIEMIEIMGNIYNVNKEEGNLIHQELVNMYLHEG